MKKFYFLLASFVIVLSLSAQVTLPTPMGHARKATKTERTAFLKALHSQRLAESTTATFTYDSDSKLNQTINGITVKVEQGTGSSAPKYYDPSMRLYTNNTITISGSKITKVLLKFTKQGSKQYANLKADCGTLTSGGESKSNTDEKTDTWDAPATGDVSKVVFNIDGSGQRVLVSITVTGEGGSGSGDEDKDDEEDLDPTYVYSEPTNVTANIEPCSQSSYSFIKNNVKVSCNQGAITADYFSCYAGQSITFTATQNIKAIVINGLTKKNFDATASNGDIDFAWDDEEDCEGNPVLIVKNVNSKTLTLQCVKQLRCYDIDFYFVENPDIEIEGGGGDEGEYNYDYEPTTPTTLNITFDSMEYEDYSEYFGFNIVDLFFKHNDYEMEMYVYAPLAEGTVLAPGTYEINDTYEDGTVQASPGGDDYFDYPTFISTDFEYDEESEGWYYTTSYYLVSGTLKVENDPAGVKMTLTGKTYYGSTVTATYVGVGTGGVNSIKDITADKVQVRKAIRDGQIQIEKNGIRYNVHGIEIR